MATNQFAPKSELFSQLRSIFNQKQSGMLTLLTDAKKSVLMRFSHGELTSARCRSWEITNTIEALLEAETVKFSYISNRNGEDKPPLMAANDFMLMIDPGGSGLVDTAQPAAVSGAEPAAAVPDSADAAAETAEKEQKTESSSTFEVDKVTAARMNYF